MGARYLIGIDDTDNLESAGTGRRARQLGEALAAAGLARVEGITRHQLLVSPRIPYTSHNSSACLTVTAAARFEDIRGLCRDFLLAASAPGSDAGLCLAAWGGEIPELVEFGERAKMSVLRKSQAMAVPAANAGIVLEGLTGDHGGVIGALAAVGLRAGGEDGRFLWLPGLRELSGVYACSRLAASAGIDEVRGVDGETVPPGALIEAGEWVRPVLRGGKAVLLMERKDGQDDGWRLLARERVKAIS